MPISSIDGIWSADLWNPKYASHVYKVTVAVGMLGNIIWICPFEFTAIALLCNVLCREGVRSNVVYLGGFSMRGSIWAEVGIVNRKVARRVHAGQTFPLSLHTAVFFSL